MFLLAFIVLIALFLYGFFLGDFAIAILSRFFGMLIISLALSLIFWELEMFVNFKLKVPKLKITSREAQSNLDGRLLVGLLVQVAGKKLEFHAAGFLGMAHGDIGVL